MPLVRFVGGSMNGEELAAPDVVADHQQREVLGPDPDRPYEMYVRAPQRQGAAAVLFEYTASSATRLLDDDQNPIDPAQTEQTSTEQGAGQ